MNISEITPYITFATPFFATFALLDFVLNDSVKGEIYTKILRLSHIGTRPFRREFYYLCFVVSVLFTVIVMSVTGIANRLDVSSESVLAAIKSSAAIILAIVIKVFILDYVMALKSAVFWGRFLNEISKLPPERKRNIGIGLYITMSSFVLCDVAICAILTQAVFFYAENYQRINFSDVTRLNSLMPNKVVNFFDEVNFVLKSSVESTLYIFNGGFTFYLVFGWSTVLTRIFPSLDVCKIKQNIFKILASMILLLILVIIVVFKIKQ